MKTLEVNQTVEFDSYTKGTDPSEIVFEQGDKLTVKELDAEPAEGEAQSYLVEREDGQTGYVFATEVKEAKAAKKTAAKKTTAKKAAKKTTAKKAAAKKTAKSKTKAKTATFQGFADGVVPPENLEDLEEGTVVTIVSQDNQTVTGTVEIDGHQVMGTFTHDELGLSAPAAKKAAKKTAKPTESSDTEEEEELAPITHSPSVKKLLGTTAKATIKAAADVTKSIESNYYVLGGLLSEIKQKAYHETLKDDEGNLLEGKSGFETFITDKLGTSYRMAQHHLNVYEVTRRAGIPEGKVKGLKCSKVVQLLDLIRGGAITKENWDEWSDKAKNLKGEAYKEAVTSAKVDAGIEGKASRGHTANQVRFTFVLFNDRAEVANKALALAKEQMEPREDGEEHSNSEAFDHILSEWATQNAAQ